MSPVTHEIRLALLKGPLLKWCNGYILQHSHPLQDRITAAAAAAAAAASDYVTPIAPGAAHAEIRLVHALLQQVRAGEGGVGAL